MIHWLDFENFIIEDDIESQPSDKKLKFDIKTGVECEDVVKPKLESAEMNCQDVVIMNEVEEATDGETRSVGLKCPDVVITYDRDANDDLSRLVHNEIKSVGENCLSDAMVNDEGDTGVLRDNVINCGENDQVGNRMRLDKTQTLQNLTSLKAQPKSKGYKNVSTGNGTRKKVDNRDESGMVRDIRFYMKPSGEMSDKLKLRSNENLDDKPLSCDINCEVEDDKIGNNVKHLSQVKYRDTGQ